LTRERISFKEKKDTTKLHTQANKVEDLCTFHQPLTMSTVPGLEKAMGYWRRNKRPSTVKEEIETEICFAGKQNLRTVGHFRCNTVPPWRVSLEILICQYDSIRALITQQ
jgi:hypothetical protein